MRFGKFCFTGAAEVVKELRPRLDAGAFDNLGQLRSEVLFRLTKASHYEFGSRLCLLERRVEVGEQFGKQGYPTSSSRPSLCAKLSQLMKYPG